MCSGQIMKVYPFARTASPLLLVNPAYGFHEYATVNDVKIHYVAGGNRSKQLLLLLHGFPEVKP